MWGQYRRHATINVALRCSDGAFEDGRGWSDSANGLNDGRGSPSVRAGRDQRRRRTTLRFPQADKELDGEAVSEDKARGHRQPRRALGRTRPARAVSPAGWRSFTASNWLARSARGTLLEGECDFILLEPEKGILFVEVKGGSLVFDGDRWVRQVGSERRKLNKDPFAQAQRGMHDIVDLVSRRHGRKSNGLPFAYGFAVAFPDCPCVRLAAAEHPARG